MTQTIFPWRLRPDGKTLWAPGHGDRVPGGIIVPPPGATPAVYGLLARSVGQVIEVTPPVITTRDDLVSGVDKPTTANTGILATVASLTQVPALLTNYTDQSATVKVIADKWFTGQVQITGKNYHFQNCWFSGNWKAYFAPLVRCEAATASGTEFLDCTFAPQNPRATCTTVHGHHFITKRCHIFNVSDGMNIVGPGTTGSINNNYTGADMNVTIQQCLFERGAYFAPDGGRGLIDNQSHLDLCFQGRGGNNILVEGNTVNGFLDLDPTVGDGSYAPLYFTSGTHVKGYAMPVISSGERVTMSLFMMSPVFGQYDNLRIRKNWFNGADYMINGGANLTVGPRGAEFTDNRIGRKHGHGNIIKKAAWPLLIARNKYFEGPGPTFTPSTGDESTWPDANTFTNG